MPSLRLFDTHSHFFTDDTERFPIDVTGAREGEAEVRARIARDPATAERLLALWDQCGVTGGAGVQYNTIYKTDNSYTLSVADAHHERVSAVLILRAEDPETPEKLRALVMGHNVRGLRLFGFPDADDSYPWLDSLAALETWEVAASLGLTMVLMYVPGKPTTAVLRRIIALATRFPDMTIALDHCGWPSVENGVAGTIGPELLELRPFKNIVFKFTQINLNRFAETGIDAAAFVRLIVDTYGAGRVLWGSDYGNTKDAYPDMVAQAIAATSQLNDAERAQVLHDNGAKLFACHL